MQHTGQLGEPAGIDGDGASGAGPGGPFLQALGRARATLTERLLAERDRWLLWLPVCLGVGVAAFFSLPAEPPRAAGLAAVALACAGALAAWVAGRGRRALRRAGGIAVAAVAVGFALAQARLEAVRAPVLPREGTFEVTGRVADLEPRGRGVRLRLEDVAIPRVAPADTPHAVRVSLARGGGELRAGQTVRVRARLQPPAGPALPGGFDYARQAYFDRLGGVGYAIGAPAILSPADGAAGEGVAGVRSAIARRITEVVPGAAGAFSAAVIAGTRAGIDGRTWNAFQVSGLAHLISISGLHMTLVAGTVFLAARHALALIPWLALRVRVHKPAALLALPAAAGYALLAGDSVPTQRSFLMVVVALAAVLIDRNPFSLRVLAWAAVVVLALRPEALVGASFQLSFAAVLALMATFEAFRLRRGRAAGADAAEPGPLGRALAYVAGVAATTLVASSATAPFAAHHFNNVATYGVVANLVAVPVTSFVVMPAGLLGLALMPLGLDGPAFALMGLGSEAVVATARLVAAMPGASVAVAQWPVSVLVLMSLGGLWLALWRRRWRLLGLVPCAVAALLAARAPVPDLVVAPGLAAAARRLPDGRVVLLEWDRDARRRESWLEAQGVRDALRGPAGGGAVEGAACDEGGCVLRLARGATVSLARTPGAAAEDCGLADLVIARAGPERCGGGPGSASAARMMGPRRLRASDGLVVRVAGGRLLVETVAESRGDWPWAARLSR